MAPAVIVKDSKGYFKKYKTTSTSIHDGNIVDAAIDKFITESRKEKLIRLNL
jgi:hypothetical protein